MLNEEHFQDLIPTTGAIAVVGVRILGYLNQDGQMAYRFKWNGDAQATEVIGLLELIKTEMAMTALGKDE
jgi:hypothetical protein